MRGDNHLLALTTATDEVTGEVKPLFAFPIQVCKATEEPDVKLDIAAPSGEPRQQVYLDPATGEIVADEDCLRGIRVGDDLRPIDPDAWKNIGAEVKEKTGTMVALGKVDLTPEFWMRYAPRITGRYFIQSPAKGGSPKAYRLTYEALREVPKKRGQAGAPARGIVTKRCPRTKQKLCVIYADESLGCLVMVEMCFAANLREPDAQILAPQAATVADAQIEMARTVVANLGEGTHALDAEVDEAVAMRQALVDQALEGVAIPAPTRTKAQTTGDANLEALLEASIAAVAS